jgi:probable addiction module antidote protein
MKVLKKRKEAAAYLNAALEDGDPEVFLLALKDVADAQGGVRSLALKSRLNRENLYRMLSKKGNPELSSLHALLEAMGFGFEIKLKKAG